MGSRSVSPAKKSLKLLVAKDGISSPVGVQIVTEYELFMIIKLDVAILISS